MLKDGGYETLRPTSGWYRISGRRLLAQRKLAVLRQIIDLKMGRIG